MHKINIEPLKEYASYLNSIFNQTVTDSRVTVFQNKNNSVLYITRHQNLVVLPLELKPHRYLHFMQRATVQPDDKIRIEECRYAYSLSDDPDNEKSWVCRYEFSLAPNKFRYPHAHIHVNAKEHDIKHIHFPTGRISIEQLLAHLIIEHHVEPRDINWFKLLAESHKEFIKKRTDTELYLFP